MAIQFHTYLSPQDDAGEEVIDKAVYVLGRSPRIRRSADGWVAEPLGNMWKSRAKYRAGKPPEEKEEFNILDRFTPVAENGITPMHVQLPLVMGNNVKDFQKQIEYAALALILALPEQAGSVIVND